MAQAYNLDQQNIPAQHTLGHYKCPACVGVIPLSSRSIDPNLYFVAAFESWLQRRTITSGAGQSVLGARYIGDRTIRDYKACARALGKFFGALRLCDIKIGHIESYQRARAECDQSVCLGDDVWQKRCGANRIRKEVALLLRMLKSAQLWGEDQGKDLLLVRREEVDVPRAMSQKEQDRFLSLAASKKEWADLCWYSILALETTCSTNELRNLRLGDIQLDGQILQIRKEGAKNKYRIRTIPLESQRVLWAVEQLRNRAREFGSNAPHHYLFPFRVGPGLYDPLHAMSNSGLKKRWDSLRKAAGIPWLRPYDLRHTAITRYAEAGTPIQVIMALAGHISLRMQQHYTAISMASRRKWVQSTWREMDYCVRPGFEELSA